MVNKVISIMQNGEADKITSLANLSTEEISWNEIHFLIGYVKIALNFLPIQIDESWSLEFGIIQQMGCLWSFQIGIDTWCSFVGKIVPKNII